MALQELSLRPLCYIVTWPHSPYLIRVAICAIYTGHVLARIFILPKTSKSSLTNNMQVLYTIDQSWCVRRWDLQRTIKAMQIHARVCLFVRSTWSVAAHRSLNDTKVPRERFERGAVCSVLYSSREYHTMIDLHTANSQNLEILGNIEILARTRPVNMARMVSLYLIQQLQMTEVCRTDTSTKLKHTELKYTLKYAQPFLFWFS